MNENESKKVDSQDIPNYTELTDDDKMALETFIDIVMALDEIQMNQE